MSKAQKLVNSAKAILQRLQSGGLNDQKALAEIYSLIDRTEDDGSGTASEQVKLAKTTMQQHKENALDNHQAVTELSRIFAGPTVARHVNRSLIRPSSTQRIGGRKSPVKSPVRSR